MNIWAHRGCSQNYPENTILAFAKAAELKGLAGIELDIQLTKDGELVVIHDESVNRTTEGCGFVRDYTLRELKLLHIFAGENPVQQIPTMEEVLDLLEPELKQGMKLNIELKNSVYPYPGMEEKILKLVDSRGQQDSIIYSSFSALSMERMKRLEPTAQTGILDTKVSDCLYKLRGGHKCRRTPSLLEGNGFIGRVSGRISGQSLFFGASVSGEAHGDKAGFGTFGKKRNYGCVFE